MLAALGQQEQGRDQDGRHIPPIHLLSVFDQVDLVVRHAPARVLGIENQVLLVHGLYHPGTPWGDLRNGAADILRAAPVGSSG
jgi:hypothetical protein